MAASPSASPSSTAVPAPTTLDHSEEDATTTLYRAALGPVSANYYLPRFARFDAAERAGLSWNWAACLCTLNWLAFRQLWGAALGYAGALVGLSLMVFGIGRLIFHFSDTVELALLLGFAALAFGIPGALGNAHLHAECRKRMARALATNNTLPEACALLRRQSSSRQRLMWLGLGNAAVVATVIGADLGFAPGGGFPYNARVPAEPSAAALKQPDKPVAAAVASVATPIAPFPTEVVVAASLPTEATVPATAPATPPVAVTTVLPPAEAIEPPVPVPEVVPAAVPVETVISTAPSPAAVKRAKAAKAAEAAKAAKAEKVAKAGKPTKVTAAPAAAAASTTRMAIARSAAAVASAAEPAAAKPVPGKSVFVNAGLFAKESNARVVHSKLADAGFNVFTQELKTANGPRIRIRVGPYENAAEAAAAADTIRGLGLEAAVPQN